MLLFIRKYVLSVEHYMALIRHLESRSIWNTAKLYDLCSFVPVFSPNLSCLRTFISQTERGQLLHNYVISTLLLDISKIKVMNVCKKTHRGFGEKLHFRAKKHKLQYNDWFVHFCQCTSRYVTCERLMSPLPTEDILYVHRVHISMYTGKYSTTNNI